MNLPADPAKGGAARHLTIGVLGLSFAMLCLGLPGAFGQGKSERQKTYTSPEAAARALGAAYDKGDRTAMAKILGDRAWRLVFSGDPVIDRHERAWFLSLFRERHAVEVESEARAVLALGKDEIPYPIPIVKRQSRWRFDPSEGHEDLLSRRISKAELSALNVVVAYAEAQRAYHEKPWRGDGVREYARRIRSTPGQQDGLIWEGRAGRFAGPLAGLAEALRQEGYRPTKEGAVPVYRGYAYKLLDGQGPEAPGGARAYVVDGRMTGGFAVVAFPARDNVSGVMTFLVNQDGVVYQKDLGPNTAALCRQMTQFNPDATWTKGRAN